MSHTDKPAHPPTDETPEDVRFLRINWALSRAARLFFLLVIASAILGVFGNGPLSSVTARAGGVELTHARFIRADGRLVLRLTPAADEVTIVLDGLMDPADDLECVPEPASQALSGRTRRLVVPVERGREAVIEMRWNPRAPGVHRGTVEFEGQRFEVWAMAYP